MTETNRRIHTVALRKGRITKAQSEAIAKLLPAYRVANLDGHLDLREHFPGADRFAVEIGFGDGAGLLEMASSNPSTGYLGIDLYRPGIGRLLIGLERLGLGNVRVADEDARDVMATAIAPGSIDDLYVMFPDPWPKKRHYKRRLMQPEFAALCADRLKPGGHMHVATDWENYAEHLLDLLDATDGLRNAAGSGFMKRPDRSVTRFEQRARTQGREVYDLLYEKAG